MIYQNPIQPGDLVTLKSSTGPPRRGLVKFMVPTDIFAAMLRNGCPSRSSGFTELLIAYVGWEDGEHTKVDAQLLTRLKVDGTRIRLMKHLRPGQRLEIRFSGGFLSGTVRKVGRQDVILTRTVGVTAVQGALPYGEAVVRGPEYGDGHWILLDEK